MVNGLRLFYFKVPFGVCIVLIGTKIRFWDSDEAEREADAAAWRNNEKNIKNSLSIKWDDQSVS